MNTLKGIKQLQIEPEKRFRSFNGIRTHGLCAALALQYSTKDLQMTCMKTYTLGARQFSISLSSKAWLLKILLRNVIAETLLRKQMFSSSRARNIRCGNKFCSWGKQENVSASGLKQFCFRNTNFTSETYVSQFPTTMAEGEEDIRATAGQGREEKKGIGRTKRQCYLYLV